MIFLDDLTNFVNSFNLTKIDSIPKSEKFVFLKVINREDILPLKLPTPLSKKLYIDKFSIETEEDIVQMITNRIPLTKNNCLELFHLIKNIEFHEDLVMLNEKSCYYLAGPLTPVKLDDNLKKKLVIDISIIHYIHPKKLHYISTGNLQRSSVNLISQFEAMYVKNSFYFKRSSIRRNRNPSAAEYLSLIWWERDPQSPLRAFQKLIKMVVRIISTNSDTFFIDLNNKSNNSYDSSTSFIVGVSGGISRGEFGKYSDIDLVLIHEGNSGAMEITGFMMKTLLTDIPLLNLCNWHSLDKLNFHQSELALLVQGIINGEVTLNSFEIQSMIESIELIRGYPLTNEERRKAVSKYYWSFMKGILDVIPLYESPIGLGKKLREGFHGLIRDNWKAFISAVYQFDMFINEDLVNLIDKFKKASPDQLNSVFKSHSGIISVQDIATFLSIRGSFPVELNETVDRLQEAMKLDMINESCGEQLIEIYTMLRKLKYLQKENLPLNALKKMSERTRELVISIYTMWLE